jgi:hypothetical protein
VIIFVCGIVNLLNVTNFNRFNTQIGTTSPQPDIVPLVDAFTLLKEKINGELVVCGGCLVLLEQRGGGEEFHNLC